MLSLFFVDDIDNPLLNGENAHHVERVLRMNVGEELLISDGRGKWARCKIDSISKREVALSVIESGFEEPVSMRVSVLQAIPKSDRARETVELLTAAGVTEILPWQASRSIGKESEKWQSAAIEASKQSRRFHIPNVRSKVAGLEAKEILKDFDQILICHESAKIKLSESVAPALNTLIVIGPEGGLTEEEVELFKMAGGKTVKMGRPILRSAHAGIAAVSAVSALMRLW